MRLLRRETGSPLPAVYALNASADNYPQQHFCPYGAHHWCAVAGCVVPQLWRSRQGRVAGPRRVRGSAARAAQSYYPGDD
jgi:hypothetical protein